MPANDQPESRKGESLEPAELAAWLRKQAKDADLEMMFGTADRFRAAADLLTRSETGPTLPPFDDEMIAILGRPNFACVDIARILRASGWKIAEKSEAEQAACLYFMLTLRLKHGEGWREKGDEELSAMLKTAQSERGGEA